MMLLAIATVEAYMLPSSSAPVFVSRPAVRSAAVAMEVEAPKKGLGFVNGEMRAAAMKLHTRDQAPKEGQQPAQKPVSVWAPGRADYLRFLVDSREVYRCMDDLVATTPAYAPFRNSGLERVAALDADIAWFAAEGEPTPAVGKPGADYVEVLRGIETGSPAFVCHFYNQYFAHTAGGLMIGKKMSDALLDGRTLEFYKWGDAGDVNPKEVCRAAPRRTPPARRRRRPLAPTAAALTLRLRPPAGAAAGAAHQDRRDGGGVVAGGEGRVPRPDGELVQVQRRPPQLPPRPQRRKVTSFEVNLVESVLSCDE